MTEIKTSNLLKTLANAFEAVKASYRGDARNPVSVNMKLMGTEQFQLVLCASAEYAKFKTMLEGKFEEYENLLKQVEDFLKEELKKLKVKCTFKAIDKNSNIQVQKRNEMGDVSISMLKNFLVEKFDDSILDDPLQMSYVSEEVFKLASPKQKKKIREQNLKKMCHKCYGFALNKLNVSENISKEVENYVYRFYNQVNESKQTKIFEVLFLHVKRFIENADAKINKTL